VSLQDKVKVSSNIIIVSLQDKVKVSSNIIIVSLQDKVKDNVLLLSIDKHLNMWIFILLAHYISFLIST
jgi:hypothetical protein